MKMTEWRSGIAAAAACITLSACNLGGADKSSANEAPPVSSPQPTANATPTLAGNPSTNSVAGSPYAFQPSATDADGDTLGFSITGKPSWAAFNTATGALTGTPTTAQVGTYSNIVITVSDGKVSQVLPAFAITVSLPATAGTATLSWSAPTQNTDGSQLSNLGGYKLYRGTNSSSLNDVRTVAANLSSFQFTALASGTHYFAISAFNTDGVESAMSIVGSKAIP